MLPGEYRCWAPWAFPAHFQWHPQCKRWGRHAIGWCPTERGGHPGAYAQQVGRLGAPGQHFRSWAFAQTWLTSGTFHIIWFMSFKVYILLKVLILLFDLGRAFCPQCTPLGTWCAQGLFPSPCCPGEAGRVLRAAGVSGWKGARKSGTHPSFVSRKGRASLLPLTPSSPSLKLGQGEPAHGPSQACLSAFQLPPRKAVLPAVSPHISRAATL